MAWDSEGSNEASVAGASSRLWETAFGRDRRKRREKEGVTGEGDHVSFWDGRHQLDLVFRENRTMNSFDCLIRLD